MFKLVNKNFLKKTSQFYFLLLFSVSLFLFPIFFTQAKPITISPCTPASAVGSNQTQKCIIDQTVVPTVVHLEWHIATKFTKPACMLSCGIQSANQCAQTAFFYKDKNNLTKVVPPSRGGVSPDGVSCVSGGYNTYSIPTDQMRFLRPIDEIYITPTTGDTCQVVCRELQTNPKTPISAILANFETATKLPSSPEAEIKSQKWQMVAGQACGLGGAKSGAKAGEQCGEPCEVPAKDIFEDLNAFKKTTITENSAALWSNYEDELDLCSSSGRDFATCKGSGSQTDIRSEIKKTNEKYIEEMKTLIGFTSSDKAINIMKLKGIAEDNLVFKAKDVNEVLTKNKTNAIPIGFLSNYKQTLKFSGVILLGYEEIEAGGKSGIYLNLLDNGQYQHAICAKFPPDAAVKALFLSPLMNLYGCNSGEKTENGEAIYSIIILPKEGASNPLSVMMSGLQKNGRNDTVSLLKDFKNVIAPISTGSREDGSISIKVSVLPGLAGGEYKVLIPASSSWVDFQLKVAYLGNFVGESTGLDFHPNTGTNADTFVSADGSAGCDANHYPPKAKSVKTSWLGNMGLANIWSVWAGLWSGR